MGLRELVSNHTALQAAWLRVKTWYYQGEFVPQPEFAQWELNPDTLLSEVGESLASRAFAPSPMLLVPHAKKNGRLRHYCQPTVRDQVAFTLLGVLLAPVLELKMYPFSFGNRWYRGLRRIEVDRKSLWENRDWSLADKSIYQPYRRAHGLFRRVASWTVGAMLRCETPTENSLGPMASPDEFGTGHIPEFAKTVYWQHFPPTNQVYWARFDLKLAYPSVRIARLRYAIKSILRSAFPEQATGLAEAMNSWIMSENLRRFDSSIRQNLKQREVIESLADYLCDLLAQVRYIPFDQSDALFFPDDQKSPNPDFLPRGTGEGHPGLPTGLAISGFLLNVYLHAIDDEMARWFSPSLTAETGQPAAFLRFADDMVLIATTPTVLVEGISKLIQAIEPPNTDELLNIRMNWEKSQPKSVAEMLKIYMGPTRGAKLALQEWVRRRQVGRRAFATINRDAITEDIRGPFLTELVERLSDLGMEKEFDVLPEQARVRLERLQEIVVLKPDDSAVPRETQLVFAANHLVRAWFPEESRKTDQLLLSQVRRSIFEALRSATDKPRIWRAVWRIALRRPIIATPADIDQLEQDDAAAEQWLLKVVTQFARSADEEKVRPAALIEEREILRWKAVWPLFASFQRSALLRGFAAVNRDVQWHAIRLSEDKTFAPPHSWLYRVADEQTLARIPRWLQKIALQCLSALYDGAHHPLPPWEAQSLAVALLSMIPRSFITMRASRSGRLFLQEAAKLSQGYHSDFTAVAELLRFNGFTDSEANVSELLVLATSFESDDSQAAHAFMAMNDPADKLLRVLEALHWSRHVTANVRRLAMQELDGHDERLALAKALDLSATRRELNRYQRARQICLATEGIAQ